MAPTSLVAQDSPTAPATLASDTPTPDTPTPSDTPAPSDTPQPTATYGPTPTETLLPTLELPTLAAVEPAFEVWDGVPTYPADSLPGYYFRVKYNPRVWAKVEDSYGQPALGHREIEYCILSPALARGLTPGLQVEHEIRQIGNLFFEVNTALQNGVRQFITYQATDNVIFTSFRLDFVDRVDDCIADAEVALGTLTSVPQSEATPVGE
ncbi:MAG: hypothetical protein AB1750_00150 [Chloroflexota bacterium]